MKREIWHGHADLDINEVELASLRFHGPQPVSVRREDVNGDGLLDLLLEFPTLGMRLPQLATRAQLRGWMKDSQLIFGDDGVPVLPPTQAPACR